MSGEKKGFFENLPTPDFSELEREGSGLLGWLGRILAGLVISIGTIVIGDMIRTPSSVESVAIDFQNRTDKFAKLVNGPDGTSGLSQNLADDGRFQKNAAKALANAIITDDPEEIKYRRFGHGRDDAGLATEKDGYETTLVKLETAISEVTAGLPLKGLTPFLSYRLAMSDKAEENLSCLEKLADDVAPTERKFSDVRCSLRGSHGKRAYALNDRLVWLDDCESNVRAYVTTLSDELSARAEWQLRQANPILHSIRYEICSSVYRG